VVDIFSKSERSRVMRSIHSKGTGPEKKCEILLRSLGIRFRRQTASLPGRPDFTLGNPGVALFIHGCFWHAHEGCEAARLPKSNADYWASKIDGNRRRDRRIRDALRRSGWRTAVIWECRLRNVDSVTRRLLRLGYGTARGKKLR
jgi:DNA mismatch endonuclease, patch repair protein